MRLGVPEDRVACDITRWADVHIFRSRFSRGMTWRTGCRGKTVLHVTLPGGPTFIYSVPVAPWG